MRGGGGGCPSGAELPRCSPRARGSSRPRVGRGKCDMPRSGRGGARAGRRGGAGGRGGRGLALSLPPTFPAGRSLPARPGPAQRPPPARQARHSLRGHVASCRPRGHAVGWRPGGGRAGSGRKRAPGRGCGRGPPGRNSSPSRGLGPHAGQGAPRGRLVRVIARGREAGPRGPGGGGAGLQNARALPASAADPLRLQSGLLRHRRGHCHPTRRPRSARPPPSPPARPRVGDGRLQLACLPPAAPSLVLGRPHSPWMNPSHP